MKDIDIRNIQPVVERRTPDKAGSAQKPTGPAFEKVLDAKMAQANADASLDTKVTAVNDKVKQTADQIRTIQRDLQRTLLEMQMRKNKSDA